MAVGQLPTCRHPPEISNDQEGHDVKHATPLDSDQREQRYLAQTGAKVLTPRQQRRLNKKGNRAALLEELRHQQAGFNAEQARLLPPVTAA